MRGSGRIRRETSRDGPDRRRSGSRGTIRSAPDGHHLRRSADRAHRAARRADDGPPVVAAPRPGAGAAGRGARVAAGALGPRRRLRAGRPARIRQHRLQAGVRDRHRVVGLAPAAALADLRAGAVPGSVVARPDRRGDGAGAAAGERAVRRRGGRPDVPARAAARGGGRRAGGRAAGGREPGREPDVGQHLRRGPLDVLHPALPVAAGARHRRRARGRLEAGARGGPRDRARLHDPLPGDLLPAAGRAVGARRGARPGGGRPD